jgi:SPP1 family predicted phage head-tail adaptor
MIPVSKLPYSVEIQAKTTGYDDEGIPIQTWETVATIRADIQPLGGELAQKEYGIVEVGITARMFCNPSEAVQEARRVIYDGKTYEIRHVAAYRGHYEVLLRPEVT